MLVLQRTYCDAFQKGSTDLSFDYHLNVRSKKSVQVTFDKQVLDQKVNEQLQHKLTQLIDTTIGSLAVKPQDVTLVIDGGSSFCLPDNRLFRDFFPQQQVVELHRPFGLSRGLYAFDTQRRQWYLGKEQVEVESHDSPELGLVLCKVREELALREEVEALRLENMEEAGRKLGSFPKLGRKKKWKERFRPCRPHLYRSLMMTFPWHTQDTTLVGPWTNLPLRIAVMMRISRVGKRVSWNLKGSTRKSYGIPGAVVRVVRCFLDLHSVKVLAIQFLESDFWKPGSQGKNGCSLK